MHNRSGIHCVRGKKGYDANQLYGLEVPFGKSDGKISSPDKRHKVHLSFPLLTK